MICKYDVLSENSRGRTIPLKQSQGNPFHAVIIFHQDISNPYHLIHCLFHHQMLKGHFLEAQSLMKPHDFFKSFY